MTRKARCLYCHQGLTFRPGEGWKHDSTGTLYIQRQQECRTCRGVGWIEESDQNEAGDWQTQTVLCLTCNGAGSVMVDDHAGIPRA